MKKIVLSPNTFLWHKEGQGLLYNPEIGSFLKFSTQNPWIESFCHAMDSLENLYACDVDTLSIDNETDLFISQIVNLKLGKIVPKQQMIVSYPPTPYVINNINRMSETGFDKFDLLNYISSCTIYLGGGGKGNYWYLQTDYPFYSSFELTIAPIMSIFERLGASEKKNITVVVSKKNDDRIRDLASIYTTTHLSFLFSLDSFRDNIKFIDSIQRFNHNTVLAILPNEIKALEKELEYVITNSFSLRFLINDAKSMKAADELVEKYHLNNCDYFPLWDNNYDFFEQNVLLSEKEILSGKTTKRTIHCHQLLNINYWGKLNVLPDGKIYADLNEPPIGSINDALYTIVEKELINGASWRKIRNNEKCMHCLCQWLCPSPSAFETLSGHTACKSSKNKLYSPKEVRIKNRPHIINKQKSSSK